MNTSEAAESIDDDSVEMDFMSLDEFNQTFNPTQPDGTPCATATTCDVMDICDGDGCSLNPFLSDIPDGHFSEI